MMMMVDNKIEDAIGIISNLITIDGNNSNDNDYR